MKIFQRRAKKNYLFDNVILVDYKTIEHKVAELEGLGKEACLDIGSSEYPSDIYQQSNVRQFGHVDFVGDVRCCFAPGYMEHLNEYPDLAILNECQFKFIRMTHFMEHVEWPYQEFLLRWVRSLLVPGGCLYISVPNIEYAIRLYVAAWDRIRKGKPIDKFPFSDHPYTSGIPNGDYDTPYKGIFHHCDITRWFNARTFSGCSMDYFEKGATLGDYHHCGLDAVWLSTMLLSESLSGGFVNVKVYDGKDVHILCQRSSAKIGSVSTEVERIFG